MRNAHLLYCRFVVPETIKHLVQSPGCFSPVNKIVPPGEHFLSHLNIASAFIGKTWTLSHLSPFSHESICLSPEYKTQCHVNIKHLRHVNMRSVTLVTWIYCSSRANTTLWLRCTLCSDENKKSIYTKTSSWDQNVFVSSKHVVSFVLSPLSHLAQLPSCFFSMLFNPQYITIYIKVNRIKSKFSFFIVFNCFLFCQQKIRLILKK